MKRRRHPGDAAPRGASTLERTSGRSDEGGTTNGAGPDRCTLRVEGMDCAGCARTVDRALRGLDGVEDVRVDAVGGRVDVRYAAARVGRAEFADEIERAGYRVAPGDGADGERAARRSPPARLVLAVVSGTFWAASLVAAYLLDVDALAGVLAVGAVIAGGWYVFPQGLRAARRLSLDMNFLMSVAAIGALAIGEWSEAGAVMFLFAVAQLLEARSMDRARDAIRSLMDLSPTEATVVRDGREARVPADEVAVGERVVVRPGEKIPVDGEVLAGRSSVDQAAITGESMPVAKEPAGEVFAGTLNGDGALEIRSTKPASDTTFARIVHAVEEAQASRAPSQRFVDRFARIYTPAVVATAVGLALLPPLAGLGAWGEWSYRALVLLVVACPCALVISTPVTVVSALAGAARRGVLIKGGLHLENAGRTRVVAIDKTGTLTEGAPSVVDVRALGDASAREVLTLAAAAERRSEHPLARAIVRRAAADGVRVPPAAETKALAGRGVRARVDGDDVYVGSPRLFGSLTAEARRALEHHESRGRTAVLVGTAGSREDDPSLLGLIAIADRPRAGATDALRALHGAGIERVVMLTGDNPGTASAIADALGGPGAGVDEWRASLLPEDKVAAAKALRAEHGTLIMVGDGVNDAPALAAADVGVAMGAAGTDVALETADIALMADDLAKLPLTIRLARRAERIIRANIGFSLAIKAVFVALAVTGLATLWMAVLADMGASLLVTANGLRALRVS